MKTLPAAFLLALTVSPALAQEQHCNDYWFARNQLFDRAGYCFSSPLGKTVFDNAGCIGTDVTLEPGGAEFVAFIKSMEADLGCKVDTDATWLDLPNIGMRMRLEVVVARSEFASGCLGWKGASIELRAGPRYGAEVLGMVRPGDDLVWEYEAVHWPDGWSFISVHRNGQEIGMGWTDQPIPPEMCTTNAG